MENKQEQDNSLVAPGQGTSIVWATSLACAAIVTVSSYVSLASKTEPCPQTRWMCPQLQVTALIVNPSKNRDRDRFYFNVQKLENETRYTSNYGRVVSHPSYRAIVGMGKPAVPFLMAQLAHGSAGMYTMHALEDITQENPVSPEHERDATLMIADWLSWGTKNGIAKV